MSKKTQCKCLTFDFSNSEKVLNRVKNYIKKYDCPEITLDLTALNVFEASKIMLLSSAYHYQKYPKGKLKCHVASENIMDLIAGLAVKNLEIV